MRSAVTLLVGAALYALAQPPFDWAVLGWLALVPLLFAVRGRSARWALGYGALYGCACSWTVAGWLAQTISRFFGLGLLLGVAAAEGYALLFWGTAFALFAGGAAILLRPQRCPTARFAIPALWVATELLRGRVLGQPWGLLGYSQHAHPALIQVAAVTAVYGVSFLLALVSTAVVEATTAFERGAHPRRVAATLALPAVAVALVWGAGGWTVRYAPVSGVATTRVAIVQTNVAPALSWTRAYTDRQVFAHLQATDALPPTLHPALIVWPEYAVPRYLETEPALGAQLARVAARHGADLLFGAPRYEAGRTYNSIRLITAGGREGGHYDKQRLVLVAEANPLASGASGDDWSEDPRQFSAGSEPGVLRSFVPLGASICHEILFPELIGRSVSAGAQLLVNVSNDGWLDGGSGVASGQHFAMAVFRAVETRRYLVRAATTGVSGVIDPYGRVVEALPAGAMGVVTASVVGRATLTPYVRLGDAFAFTCVLLAAATLFAQRAVVAEQRGRLTSALPAS